MADQTNRFALDTYAQGDDNWDHTDSVQFLDESAIERGTLADRPSSGTYDDELYLATDENKLFRWDADTSTWETVAVAVSVSDDGSVVLADPSDINFTASGDASVTVSDDGDGTVTVDVSATDTDTDTRIDVSDDGTLVVSEPTDVNFSSNLSVTDDGDGTVTVDASGSGADRAVTGAIATEVSLPK